MKQKIGVPAIAVAVILVLGLGIMLYNRFLAPSPTNTGPHTYPSFIDPATGKPKQGAPGSTGIMAPGPGGARSGGQ